MRVYRDCYSGQAGFDGSPGAQSARVTIYLGSGQNAQNMGTPNIGSPDITKIDPVVSNPCLTAPANVCVEEGLYTFTVNLIPSDKSYFIAYQRCCRNGTISNIITPGDVGATYAVEITPLAQQECNSSPTFQDFPPIAICVNDTLRFDHSATDKDGDSLVYSFCTPLYGGSKNNVAPNPESKPPYDGVSFQWPFSQNNPVGGNPQVSIDPITGEIFGFPTIQGQYVVGVCVTEYRNGEVLSITQRDFQFNIVACVQAINAEIEIPADILYGGKALICGKSVLTLINKSTPVNKISRHLSACRYRLSGSGGHPDFGYTENDLSQPGLYFGKLVANPACPAPIPPRLRSWSPGTGRVNVHHGRFLLVGPIYVCSNGQSRSGRADQHHMELQGRLFGFRRHDPICV
ncbi:MAG: hypothetical protein IPJ06_03030 [Saprospiraceae bacterium]|nr:hypothetical protein [Saprospiraceae bacterium]